MLNFLRQLFTAKPRDLAAERVEALRLYDLAMAKMRAEAEDYDRRVNFYHVDQFLAGLQFESTPPYPSAAEWLVLRAGMSATQYALTDPALQGSVGGDKFGSMRGRPSAEIAAEKWRLMALARAAGG